MVTKKIFLKNSNEVLRLLGQQDENLKHLEKMYGVQIFVRQGGGQSGDFSLVIRGSGGKVDQAMSELEHIRRIKEEAVNNNNIIPSAKSVNSGYNIGVDPFYVTSGGKKIKPNSKNQKKYVEYVESSDMVFSIGPAGTGKTFLAVACALRALKMGKVSRIVLTRPVVEAGEKLGFLPGDLYEKINPYLKPLYDSFFTMLGPEKFRFFRDEGTIEIVPLAYMRGRTLDDAFVVLDEAQNTTKEQMKMFLTRLGESSRMIITGDITQIDLEYKKNSGLVFASKALKTIKGIEIIYFSKEDIVRHHLVKNIISAYEKWDK